MRGSHKGFTGFDEKRHRSVIDRATFACQGYSQHKVMVKICTDARRMMSNPFESASVGEE